MSKKTILFREISHEETLRVLNGESSSEPNEVLFYELNCDELMVPTFRTINADIVSVFEDIGFDIERDEESFTTADFVGETGNVLKLIQDQLLIKGYGVRIQRL